MGTRELMETLYTRLFRVEDFNTYYVATLGGLTGTVALAEFIIYTGAVRVALVIYLLMFVGTLIIPAVVADGSEIAKAFVLIPLFRLVNLGIPVFSESTIVWLALIYGSIVIATVLTAVALPAARLCTRDDLKKLTIYSPVVGGAAILLGAIEYWILLPEPFVTSLSDPEGVFFVIIMVGFIGLGEELLFRGVIQSTVADYAGPGPAVVVSTLLFGVLHSGLVVPEAIAWATLTGAVFSVYYQLTANWVVTGIVRGVANVLIYGTLLRWGALSVLLG